MADDDAHHRAVQETVNRHRVLSAPFGSPPAQPSAVETNTHFIGRFIPTQFNLNRALWQNPAVDQAAAHVPTLTRQEQPDHPPSLISPGVQDPPTETASPSTVALEGRITIATKARAGMTLHEEMLRRIVSLEDAMAQLVATKPGIGHNNPPELIDPVPFGDDDRRVVEIAIVLLSAQSPKPETPPIEAGEAAAKLMAIGERLKAYAIKHGDVLVSEAVKSAGVELGKRLVQSPFWLTLASLLIAAAKAAFAWIASLPNPH
jgi:hypothetical protein